MQHKYDFLLFENLQSATHHYRDICIIAKMLKSAGYSVAIATLYEEEKYCKIEDIPIISIKHDHVVPNNLYQFYPKNKLHSFLCTIRYLYQQYHYISEFLEKIRGLANNYYAGSYHAFVSYLLIKKATKDCKIFFWGLRSYRISNFFAVFRINQIAGIRQLYLKPFILKNKNICFFVSNEIIKNEFMKFGIGSNRLVIREERTCIEVPDNNIKLMSKYFSLLTIGMLRENKRVEMLIETFKTVANNDDVYVVAGRCNDNYNNKIQLKINNDHRIKRIDSYIDEPTFNNLFDQCHFLLLGDIEEASSITNGTMLEAFLHRRPIIAPNYPPYNYYIDTFNVGLLYDPKSKKSLENTLRKARSLPIYFFDNNLESLLKLLTYSECARKVKNDLNTVFKY